MKKILLPIFGGFLLTSSLSLITGQNATTVIKQKKQEKDKKEEILNSWSVFNKQSNLTEAKVNSLKTISQAWDNIAIDKILTQALQYENDHLIINWNKLNIIKVPQEILANIDLVLNNLNNAISLNYIKVNVINNKAVELIYPNNSTNNDIVDFDNEGLSSDTYSSPYIWYSTYGPSHWWKFWEWGGYIHFNNQAVQNAVPFNIIASVANIYFLFKSIKEISTLVKELRTVWTAGNIAEVNRLINKLGSLLGGVDLDLLGNIVEVLAILTGIIAFVLAITTGAGWFAPLAQLVAGSIASVTGQMISANQGNGVKWQWFNFIIPGGIWAE